MRKISEILRQKFDLKLSYREIARSLNVSISTISDYIGRAKVAGVTWPLPEDLSEQQLYDRLFLPPDNKKLTQRVYPDWKWVHHELRKKAVTLRLLWREYRAISPNGLGYTQFCVQYRAYAKTLMPAMRQLHKAGEKIFVDYAGMKIPWLECTTGEIREAEIFVACLGASQYTFVEASASQQLPNWIESHIHMFEFFGGVSEIVVPDNLKSAVKKTHRYDPDINDNYQSLSEHYGFAIVPARPGKPKDKAKVENAVGCIERQILATFRHRTFTSIAEINQAIQPKILEFNALLFQKMDASRRLLFEKLDKPSLKALPSDRYQYAQWNQAKIHIDYHFVFENHYYSVPFQYIQKPVEIRATSTSVECFFQGKRIAAHARSQAKHKFTTLSEHMPPAHQAYEKWSPERMHDWAEKIGPHTVHFIDQMMASRPFAQQAYRSCLGLLRLGDRFGQDRLEKACERGLISGGYRYQHIENILKKGLEKIPIGEEQSAETISHDNIRGASYYQQSL